MKQTTINKSFSISGIALHSGLDTTVTVKPSGEDTGIVFIRSDIAGSPHIPALTSSVVATSYATTLGVDGVTVATVEHLMAALYGMGVDNAVVMVNGPEIPILDGSAVAFTELIDDVGIRKLDAARKYIVIKKPIKVSEGDKHIYLYPSENMEMSIDYRIDFAHPFLAKQSFSSPFSKDVFRREVVRARTFGFLKDVEMLKANGLARGGGLNNAVVIGDDDILNEEGLRFPDEFVRHKVLDFMGDIALLGHHIIGRFEAYRSGHNMNHRLAVKLLKSQGRFEFSTTGRKKGGSVYVVKPGVPAYVGGAVTA